MSQASHQEIRKAIDAHFKGRGTPKTHAMFMEHLPSCADCHQYFEKRMFLAEMMPGALNQKERIGATAGLAAPKAPRSIGVTAFLSAAAMAAGAFLIWPNVKPPHDGFQARGTNGAETVDVESQRVFGYVVNQGAENRLIEREIKVSDELLFSYRNKGPETSLMIYGVDEKNHVYWFHPAWIDAKQNPTAIAIEQSAKVIALPEAVKHDYQGNHLKIYALFLTADQATMTVQEVERLLQEHSSKKHNNLHPKMVHNLRIIR